MKLEDSASRFPLDGVRHDPFDLLDSSGDLVVRALYLAAERGARRSDIPALLVEIAGEIEDGADGDEQALTLYYLAARLRESADKTLD